MLAAGAGSRLRPLTRLRPKALCPVGLAPLVDHAIDRLAPATASLAVNVHAGREQLVAHLDGRVHLSVEAPVALGTAGALGALRDWLDGRPAVVTNADAWLPDGLDPLLDGWDGERMRLLCVEDPGRGDFGRHRYAGACLMPWPAVRDLPAEPLGLYEARWGAAAAAGTLDLVVTTSPFVDCGTPADYLGANLAAIPAGAGGDGGGCLVGDGADVRGTAERSVVGAGAVVEGTVVRSVVWPGAVVHAGEVLVDAVRADPRVTVLVRSAALR